MLTDGACIRRSKRLGPVFAIAVVAFSASEARADDAQAWSGLEARVPISDGRWGLPTAARWVTESRFGGPRDGLQFLLARFGLMWNLHPSMLFNVNGVQALEPGRNGAPRPVSRIELEPNLRASFGIVSANLRQRAELRWVSADATYRHRLQLRVNVKPKGWKVAPYVSTEALGTPGGRILEIRNVHGVSTFFGEHIRIDVGYMFRPRLQDDAWNITHAGVFWLTFEPKIPAVIESGGG
jgi:hypothetical protein